MKNLNVDQMSAIQGGRVADIIDGICDGATAVGVFVAFGLVLSGFGMALLVGVGAGCVARAVNQRL
jgi:hypothetical protein